MLRAPAKAVIWCTTTSGAALPTTAPTATGSMPSMTTASAPIARSWASLVGHRDQLRHQPPTKRSARTRYEDIHDYSLRAKPKGSKTKGAIVR